MAENIQHNNIVSDTFGKSARMLNSFDIEGVVRVSPLHCHDVNDIDEFLKITKEMTEL